MSIPLTENATLHPFVPPARADAAGSAELREFTEVRNAVYRAITGRDDQDVTPEELLPVISSDEDEKTLIWTVRIGREMVGRAMVDLPMDAGSRIAYVLIELHPHVWGQGIGTAIWPHLEAAAREHGRSILQSWAEQPASAGPTLSSPTGFGTIPHDHVARFYLRHGFALEQVERVSSLELGEMTREHVTDLMRQAQAAADGYRVVQWMLPTPAERIEGYAWMKSRMSTDVPAAELVFDEEKWDAARVARHDQRFLDGGQTVQVTAAEHIATGELCAFNELAIGQDLTAVTHQQDTLVLSTHRGHRLGMLVKCAALLSWAGVAPASPRVLTYNAEENRPMLSINEAIGFTPIAYEGAWKKVLT